MTTSLSPATAAVLRAAGDSEPGIYATIAAALRAAADQVVPISPKPDDTFCIPPVATMIWMREVNIRRHFLAIADELEGVKYGTYRCDLKT